MQDTWQTFAQTCFQFGCETTHSHTLPSLPIYRKKFKGKSYYFCCSELQNAYGITLQISYRCLTMYYKFQNATWKFCFCRITTLQRLANMYACPSVQFKPSYNKTDRKRHCCNTKPDSHTIYAHLQHTSCTAQWNSEIHNSSSS